MNADLLQFGIGDKEIPLRRCEGNNGHHDQQHQGIGFPLEVAGGQPPEGGLRLLPPVEEGERDGDEHQPGGKAADDGLILTPGSVHGIDKPGRETAGKLTFKVAKTAGAANSRMRKGIRGWDTVVSVCQRPSASARAR